MIVSGLGSFKIEIIKKMDLLEQTDCFVMIDYKKDQAYIKYIIICQEHSIIRGLSFVTRRSTSRQSSKKLNNKHFHFS